MSTPTNPSSSAKHKKSKKAPPGEECRVSSTRIFEEYRNLTDAQLLLLHRAGTKFIDGTQFDTPEDLIHEVLARMLDGRRNWDGVLPLVVFIHGAMRSIVSYERELRQQERSISVEELLHDQEQGHEEYFVVLNDDHKLWKRLIENQMSQSPEDALIEQQYCQQIEAQKELLFKQLESKPTVKAVLDAYLEGARPSELLKRFALSQDEYQKIKREIRQAICRIHIPNP